MRFCTVCVHQVSFTVHAVEGMLCLASSSGAGAAAPCSLGLHLGSAGVTGVKRFVAPSVATAERLMLATVVGMMG
jgi:hypothetical protein